MNQKFCQYVLRLLGWKTQLSVELPEKGVFCVAPHTSNWDFFLCEFLYFAVGGKHKVSFLIKKEWFKFPFGPIFRKIGGIPVDRSKKTSLVDQMVGEFNQHKQLLLAITPEATRKPNPNWKMGFFYIAKGANVPIYLVYLDYSKKMAGVERMIEVCRDLDETTVMDDVKHYYSQFKGRYPENFLI